MRDAIFPVVGVGASAGGLESFRGFLEHMPQDCGMALVMVLQQPPDHHGMLSSVIARWTPLPVVEVQDGTPLAPDHVYVVPAHALARIDAGAFSIRWPPAGEHAVQIIDDFLDSLGTALRERAAGIVLSGTGHDGALGLKALKERGGFALAEGGGAGPLYDSMPRGAVATGGVDIVCPAEQMPARLLRFRDGLLRPKPAAADEPATNAARLEICALLHAQLGHDFSDYRSQTFMRRVQRRMNVLDAPSLPSYIEALKADPGELTLLFRDLLIRVTSFFRDPGTFEAVAAKVIPRLFDRQGADGVVRIWIPGCATGEEAYTLAMLVREHMDTLGAAPRVQVFATDIDEAAIGIARQGRYPPTLLEGLPPERRKRFFSQEQGGYSVRREVRDLCTFSVHNVISDPPFSMMSMVSCRNLLIYMNPELQSRVLPLLHYALVPGGMLLLGSSESASQHPELFEVVDSAARIFQKRGASTPGLRITWQRNGDAGLNAPGLRGYRMARNRVHEQQGQYTGETGQAPPVRSLFEERFTALAGELVPDAGNIERLRNALAEVCGELQAVSGQHQTALDDLRSANEELQSVNEEMQSANEELETSREELQSVNEELHTVNLRLIEKVDELDHANSDLRNLFDSTEIATAFLDRNLVIRSFTPAMDAVYNLIPGDQGRPLTDIVSRVPYPQLREDVDQVLASLEPVERRLESTSRLLHYVVRVVPYREPDGEVTGVLVTFIDVTTIVQAEEALLEADIRKDQFLATLSHELRNPLAPIRTAAQLLQSRELSVEDMRHARQVILRQVSQMTSLLDDLLDVSRITRAAFQLKKDHVDLQAIIDAAVESVQPLMDSRQHVLRVEPPVGRVLLEVDTVRMTQVLTNLLTNAAKYTPTGGFVHVGVRFDAEHVVVFVRDNGIGLTAESMGHVFEMFSRVAGRGEGGLGIGLALAKGLMELHGGGLRVQSAGPGKGSEFQMLVPHTLRVGDEDPLPAEPPADHASHARRVLIADDNVDSATTLGMLLRLQGHDVRVAHTGADALEQLRLHPADVLICDIGMPAMSGYEVVERARREAWGRDVVMIAVTGWGQESDRRRALEAGFDHHLTKPVDPAALEKLVEG